MNIDLIEKVVGPVNEYISKETEMLPNASEGFIPIKIEEKNFHLLGLFGKEIVISAIDGGIANILSAPNFCLDFIRIVTVTNGPKKSIEKKEYFCFVTIRDEKFSIELFGNQERKMELPMQIKTLDGEKYNLEISNVGNHIRRFLELERAECIDNDIVIDGSMQVKTLQEFELMKKLCLKKQTVGFLSKTCSMLTKNAYSLNTALKEFGPKNTWYYYPIYKISNPHYLGEMLFCNFHSKSERVFKLELNNMDEDFILNLVNNSKDPIFFGYPYMLIDADKHARVTNEEKDYIKTLFVSKIKNPERLKYLLSNLDAHDILDNIG